ncbi:DUF6644 family protein [Sphingomonas sp. MMS24-J13]|uniref:DUF6644 family protein n=1 Tax=Sphingomonas sp. MMS24-J13 TaxID=3238686 RepID=UPI00384A8E86
MPAIDDLLYSLTEWLRTTPLPEFSLWIADQPLSKAMGNRFLTIPLLQTTHIIAIATAFSAVLMTNLRILGWSGAGQTMAQTNHRYRPWIVGALLTLIATGLGLIVAEPVRELINPIFWIKMVMIAGLILVSLAFGAIVHRQINQTDPGAIGSTTARVGAIALLLLWCLVIIAGRWIAYAPT